MFYYRDPVLVSMALFPTASQEFVFLFLLHFFNSILGSVGLDDLHTGIWVGKRGIRRKTWLDQSRVL